VTKHKQAIEAHQEKATDLESLVTKLHNTNLDWSAKHATSQSSLHDLKNRMEKKAENHKEAISSYEQRIVNMVEDFEEKEKKMEKDLKNDQVALTK